MAPSGQTTGTAVQELLRDPASAGTWSLDASRSTVGLRSKSVWGLVSVKGTFQQVSGSVTVSPAGEVSGTITVAAASVETKNKKRDEHLRSADFFDSGKYPDITVRVDRITPDGEGVTVAGSLIVRDQTRPVSFPATVSAASGSEVQLDAELQVDRSDYGLTWNQMGMASMSNTLTVHAVLTKS
ncbi:MAG: YceI family protein [Streptosporangiales bacterium]